MMGLDMPVSQVGIWGWHFFLSHRFPLHGSQGHGESGGRVVESARNRYAVILVYFRGHETVTKLTSIATNFIVLKRKHRTNIHGNFHTHEHSRKIWDTVSHFRFHWDTVSQSNQKKSKKKLNREKKSNDVPYRLLE